MTKLGWFIYCAFIVFVFALVFVLTKYAPAQTLQHHMEPAVQPQSCRDHLHSQRGVFIRAAILTRINPERSNLTRLAVLMDDPWTVKYICTHPRELEEIDLMSALAAYQIALIGGTK